MNRLSRIAFALVLLVCAMHALAQASSAMPFPYRAEYEVLSDGKPVGHATVQLRRDGIGQWMLTSHTRGERGMAAMAGLDVQESSRFAFDPASGKFRSLSYHYRQKAAFRTRERSVAFDAANRRIISQDQGREYRLDYRADALDRQTVTLAIAHALAQGEHGEFSCFVADREQVSEHRYRFAGEEPVSTPAGDFPAIKLEREREGDARRQTTIWLSARHGHAPLRVVQTERNGSRYEMRLETFERLE